MPVLDNSPSKKRIRWCDIQIIYNNEIYNIKDGYTDNMYVYWDLSDPNILLSSNEFPHNYIELVFINNDGVHTMYPNIDIDVIDTGNYKLKSEYLDRSILSIREFTTILDHRITSMESQIKSIRDMLVNIDNRLKALEPTKGSD